MTELSKLNDEQVPLLGATHNTTDQQTSIISRRKMNGDDSHELTSEIVLNKGSRRQEPPTPRLYSQFTNVSHVCTGAISGYIIYLCFTAEFEFFTWHPLLFAVGWMCIMTEGVFILTKNNFLADRISHTWRVRWHWILQVIAMVCTIAGFTIVVVNKNLKNKEHWKSWHGLLGLISVICAVIPTCITGVPALYHRDLRDYISSRLNQLIHSLFGISCLILGSIAMLLSLYTKWFARRTESSLLVFNICWMIMFVPLVWSLFAPIKKAIKRTESLLTEKQ